MARIINVHLTMRAKETALFWSHADFCPGDITDAELSTAELMVMMMESTAIDW